MFPQAGPGAAVEVDLVADLTTINPFDFFLDEYAEQFPFAYEPALRQELAPYLALVAGGPRLRRCSPSGCAARSPAPAGAPSTCWSTSTARVQRSLRYDIRMEPGVFAPEETLERGHGSCRDFAWLLVQLLRRLGFAARFVSGYSIQLVADQKPLEGPAGVERRRHRSARLGRGVPARRRLGGARRHQRPAVRRGAHPAGLHRRPGQRRARSPAASAGSSGGRGRAEARTRSSASTMEVHAAGRSAAARPSPTTSAPGRRHPGLRRRVDAELERQDVRLTMGGEPTFVSVDDMDGRRVEHRRAGADQGAHGRPAAAPAARAASPRGRCCTTGRASGTRASRCPAGPTPATSARTASRSGAIPSCSPTSDGRRARGRRARRRRFVQALARRLGVDPTFAHARLRGRLLLPVARAAAAGQRRSRSTPGSRTRTSARACAGCSSRGWRAMVGYALPLRARRRPRRRRRAGRAGPGSCAASACTCCPGDSPMGFRLPLDSLPWAAPDDREDSAICERDPLAPRRPLPARQSLSRQQRRRERPARPRARRRRRRPARGQSAAGVVRTALCVEPRAGHAARVHAAGRDARAVPRRWRRRSRTRRARAGPAGAPRGLSAAVGPPAAADLR